MNVFDSIVLVAAFLWIFTMGVSFIAALDWNGIIEAWCFQITIPAAIASQMVMFFFSKMSAAYSCGAFSYLTIAILNMIEKGYLYIYIALALAIIYGISHDYHDQKTIYN